MKLIINKNFNKRYMFRAVQAFLRPMNTSAVGMISNGSLSTMNISLINEMFITKESTLNTIKKISTYYSDINYSTDRSKNIGGLINAILYTGSSTRETTLAKLVTDGVITQAESDNFLIITLNTKPSYNTIVNTDSLNMTYGINDKLSRRFNKDTDNIDNETLYFCFIPKDSPRFNGRLSQDNIDYVYSSTGSEFTHQAIPFLAFSFGTGTEDIKFDYTDIIDYIDALEFNIKLPKVITI